jgi:hypothetical protein
LKITTAYKKKYLNINFIYALLFTVTLFTLTLNSSESWMIIIRILTPTCCIAKYFYHKPKKYLKIEDERIRVNTIFGEGINLNEIHKIEKNTLEIIYLKSVRKN